MAFHTPSLEKAKKEGENFIAHPQLNWNGPEDA